MSDRPARLSLAGSVGPLPAPSFPLDPKLTRQIRTCVYAHRQEVEYGIVKLLDCDQPFLLQHASLAAFAKENCPATVRAKVGSMTSLPFEDAAFDCVWSANVFQYLTEHEAATAIEEMKATPRGRRDRSAAWRRDGMA
jgi:hypothetical protein